LLRERVEQSMAGIDGPVEQLDVALRTMLHTFASHRALARLFLIDALGANREFNARILSIQSEFSQIIASRLCLAVEQGAITDIDAGLTSEVWFGALLQVVTRWLLTESRGDLEAQYPALRSILRRSIGLAPEPARGLVS
jgi:AcrR family transcriptional regulator